MSLTDNFDKLKKDNPAKREDAEHIVESNDIERYDAPSLNRKLSYTDSEGKHHFFYYAELRGGDYAPEENTITLTLHYDRTVTIKGKNLLKLFEEISDQSIKKIAPVDERYIATKDESEICVTQIFIA